MVNSTVADSTPVLNSHPISGSIPIEIDHSSSKSPICKIISPIVSHIVIVGFEWLLIAGTAQFSIVVVAITSRASTTVVVGT